MKQFLSCLLVIISLGLTGCYDLETGYQFRLCKNSNGLWVPDITDGTYDVSLPDGQGIARYFATKGPATGSYLFVQVGENNNYDQWESVYLARTCSLDGMTYLEMAYGNDPLRIYQISAQEKNSWGIQMMEPNLEKVTQAQISIRDMTSHSGFEVKKLIYNYNDKHNSIVGHKLKMSMFDKSKSDYGFVYLHKR